MIALLTLAFGLPATPVAAPDTDVRLLVAAESADEVYDLRWDGERFHVRDVVEVGYQATEIEGPHGLTVSPDGESWFVSMAHGKPNGLLYKFDASSNELVGQAELGLFPATMQISIDTGLLYCVNFDLHGDMTPSSVSIVDVDGMVEIDQITTGSMPHGSRLTPDGRTHYSCAMMSDELIEVDAVDLTVERRLLLTDGKGTRAAGHGEADEESGEPDQDATPVHAAITKPTWVQPHPEDDTAYVALNGAHQVVEVDLKKWEIKRRFPTGRAPYNLDVTSDGERLVVTYKGGQAVGIIDIESGEELARIESSRPVPHGVVVTPDGKWAFITCEDRNANPGSVDAIDLEKFERAGTIDIGLQAGGIAMFPPMTKQQD